LGCWPSDYTFKQAISRAVNDVFGGPSLPVTGTSSESVAGARGAGGPAAAAADSDKRAGPSIERSKDEQQAQSEEESREFAVEYQKQEIKILQKKLERLNLRVAKATES
jgi:ribulose kinase